MCIWRWSVCRSFAIISGLLRKWWNIQFSNFIFSRLTFPSCQLLFAFISSYCLSYFVTIGQASLKSICKVYTILSKGYLHSMFSKSIFIWFSHWLNWVSVFISPVNPSPVPEPQHSLILLCVRGKSAESLKSFENEPHIFAVQHFRQGAPNL